MKEILLLVDKIGRKKEALALGIQEYLGVKAKVYLARFSDVVVEIEGRNIKIKVEKKNIDEFSLIYFRRAGVDYHILAGAMGICLDYLNIAFFDDVFAEIRPNESKLTSQARLAIAGLPVIPFFFCWRTKILENADFIISRFGLPLVAKKTSSQRGEGVFLIKDKQDFEKVLVSDPEGQFLFQKYCSAKKEYRLLVLGEKVRVWEAKIPTGLKEFRSNVSLGAREKFYDIAKLPSFMGKIAVEAAKVLHLQIAGVDLLEEESGKIWLLEANRGPGFTYDTKISPEIKELAAFFADQLKKKKDV